MANFLLRVRFNEDGPNSNRTITNIGGVKFFYNSPLINGDRCAYFTPFTGKSCLTVTGMNGVKIAKKAKFTIYFRFKIDKSIMDDEYDTPLLTFRDDANNIDVPFIFIQNKQYFSIMFGEEGFSNESILDYIFDNRWHCVAITRDGEGKLRFFIDGAISTENDSEEAITFPSEIYIGRMLYGASQAAVFNGGCIDDLCILDDCLWDSPFIPPTLYLTGSDSKNNYYMGIESNIDQIDPFLESIADDVHHMSEFYINRVQRDYLPRRIRIRWYQERGYFKETEWNRVLRYSHDTILSVFGLELTHYWDIDRFFEGNCMRLVQQKNSTFQPFMMFVDHVFIPLSRLTIIKSDWWYTIIIKDRDPDDNPRIESVEIVTIPFPIIYEEGWGERADLKPLFVFDRDGLFNPSAGHTFYYFDPDRTSDKFVNNGIIEQYVPSYEEDKNKEEDNDLYTDSMFIHNLWRYGEFTVESVNGNNAVMVFNPWDNNTDIPINQNCSIIIYKNTVMIEHTRYRIVGSNKIEFFDYKDMNIIGNMCTIQQITDETKYNLHDLTDSKYAQVVATVDQQSVFEIPQVLDSDGLPYRYFLVFRGSISMDNEYRYYIDDEYKTITLTHTEDFVPKGSSLTFFFVKLRKSDVYGPLHVKPMYLYTRTEVYDPNDPDKLVTRIPIPEFHGLKFTENNCMVFIQDTFVSPQRYRIENNTIITDFDDFYFDHDKSVVIVVLKMVNALEDPITDHDRVVKDEMNRGRRFVLYDLNIDKRYKITLDNLTVFDNYGHYMPDLFGEIYNLNIIKGLYSSEPLRRVPRYLQCVYLKDLPENPSNTIIPTNTSFLKEYIKLNEPFYELDRHFKEFMSNFNKTYSRSEHYGVNLAKGLDYLVCYNQNVLDKVYEKKRIVDRFTFDNDVINDKMVEHKDFVFDNTIIKKVYDVTLEASEFQDMYYTTYPVIFLNGMIPSWFKYTDRTGNNRYNLHFTEKLKNTDKMETIRFHKLHNYFHILGDKPESTIKITYLKENVSSPREFISGKEKLNPIYWDGSNGGTLSGTVTYVKDPTFWNGTNGGTIDGFMIVAEKPDDSYELYTVAKNWEVNYEYNNYNNTVKGTKDTGYLGVVFRDKKGNLSNLQCKNMFVDSNNILYHNCSIVYYNDAVVQSVEYVNNPASVVPNYDEECVYFKIEFTYPEVEAPENVNIVRHSIFRVTIDFTNIYDEVITGNPALDIGVRIVESVDRYLALPVMMRISNNEYEGQSFDIDRYLTTISYQTNKEINQEVLFGTNPDAVVTNKGDEAVVYTINLNNVTTTGRILEAKMATTYKINFGDLVAGSTIIDSILDNIELNNMSVFLNSGDRSDRTNAVFVFSIVDNQTEKYTIDVDKEECIITVTTTLDKQYFNTVDEFVFTTGQPFTITVDSSIRLDWTSAGGTNALLEWMDSTATVSNILAIITEVE